MRIALIWLAAALTACGGRHARTDAPAPKAMTVAEAYDASMADAPLYRPEAVRPLLALTDEQPTVVAWTGWDGYKMGENTLGVDVWVTLAPEVKDRCKSFAADTRALRLQQLLGLPPSDGERNFVEMRITRSDAFRPCPNPDPTAEACGDAFPEGVDAAHVDFIARTALANWRVPDGYPWTRMGYTYDWAPDAADRYGATEFVVRKGSVVEVVGITPTAEYCAQ